MGNDIYMAHFANGTAEWRIGLVKSDGLRWVHSNRARSDKDRPNCRSLGQGVNP